MGVTIFSNACDLSGPLEFAQNLIQIHALAAFSAEHFGQLDFFQRAIFRRGENAQNFLLHLLRRGRHRLHYAGCKGESNKVSRMLV